MAIRRLGLDIGGANLKLSDGRGFAVTHAFALWRYPQQLAHELRTLIAEAGQADHLAATMTGELADCFETRRAGVEFILDAVSEAAAGRHTRVYLKNGTLVTLPVARRQPELAAASNWHALARYACRYVKGGSGLLVDIGSTTSDVIPLVPDGPGETAQSDTNRLLSSELVYTGVQRSPICAVARSAVYRGQPCPLAQELFATMRDVYLVLGQLPEDPASLMTANGRPATKACARQRLARSICADEVEFNHKDAVDLATSLAKAQLELIVAALDQVIGRMPEPPRTVVISGEGEFLIREAILQVANQAEVVSLSERLGPVCSRCGPAYALAVLAGEENS